MRIGIIDLGTNSVRFDIHQLGPGKRVTSLHREKLMVRLGQGVFLSGKLDHQAFDRVIEAFLSFSETSKILHTQKIIAFGTSALREASDSEKLLKQIKEKAGIEVRVISGKEEAQLISQGILANEKLPKGRFGLIDIGGGSTEITLCQGKEVLNAESFPLGTARLQQVFLKTNPPKLNGSQKDLNPVEKLRRYLRSMILTKILSEDWPTPKVLLGSSGTIRALAKILSENPQKGFELKALKKLVSKMSTMTPSELLSIPRMESKRVDMILAGAILLEECMIALKAKKIIPTEFSLRDGILEEEIQLYQKKKTSKIEFHLSDLVKKAKIISLSETHFLQVQLLSEQLFDSLKRVHKLKTQWKTYLSAAAILHDVGESIAPSNHEFHSYYMVKNADFPSILPWESEFIAELCRWHRGGKVDFKNTSFKGEKKKKEAFLKLLAILRVADALDRSHKAHAQIKKIKITSKEITLKIVGKNKTSIDLELLRIGQKKTLFESVFDRKLSIK